MLAQQRPRWPEGGHEDPGSGRLVAQRSRRPFCVVMTSPALDRDLRLPQGIENLPVRQLIREPSVEALDESVLPRTVWRAMSRRRPLVEFSSPRWPWRMRQVSYAGRRFPPEIIQQAICCTCGSRSASATSRTCSRSEGSRFLTRRSGDERPEMVHPSSESRIQQTGADGTPPSDLLR